MTEDFFGKYNWNGKTILIVEDDISSIFYLKEILKDSEADLIIAEDGQSAINLVEENSNIDIILMDIQLPVLNGYEATKIIRKSFPDLPIIAQTAYAMTQEQKKCIDAGCNSYLSKPLDPIEVLDTISKFI